MRLAFPIVSLLAVLSLGACVMTVNDFADNPTPGDACPARVHGQWEPEGNAGPFSIDAYTDGPSCAQAAATIVMRDPEGEVAYSDTYPARHVFTLADAKTLGEMNSALSGWISEGSESFASTADLPEWKEGEHAPEGGEFPFIPEEFYDQPDYERLRASAAPVYCYVQGLESMACLAIDHGALMKIGFQVFPG